jgi:hypothetical protein
MTQNKGWLCGLLAAIVAGGCGGDAFPVAKTSGRVVCEGQPVKRAQVYFEPIQDGKSAVIGKQGFSFTDDNGEFVLSTYGHLDGAVIGKHRVRVGMPEVPCDCVTNSEKDVMQVEVETGIENSFEIVLPKKTGKEPPALADRDDDDDD